MGLVFIDITLAYDLSFYRIFLTKTMKISKFHFRTTMGGNFSHFLVNFYRTYEQGPVIIDNHGMGHIILVYLFVAKTLEIIKIHFKH